MTLIEIILLKQVAKEWKEKENFHKKTSFCAEIFGISMSHASWNDKITEEDKLRRDKTLFAHWIYNN